MYPRGYRVEASLEGVTWGVVAQGAGAPRFHGFLEPLPRLLIPLPDVPARYLRLTSTRSGNRPWGVHELAVHVADGIGR